MGFKLIFLNYKKVTVIIFFLILFFLNFKKEMAREKTFNL